MDKIKMSFRKMGAAFKNVFDKMVRIAKWGGLAIAGALFFVTRAAMKQQDALFELSAALKVTGEHTEALMDRFEDFAASMQKATVLGDEEVLSLMRMGSTLGITADKLEDATKAAIALSSAFGARLRPEIAIRYYADALRGITSSLETYVGEMRSATSFEEKMIILQRAIARGWAIVIERTKTASGALKQMVNAIGDVAEKIGDAFLPMLKDSAIKIRDWAAANGKEIGQWAKVFVAHVVFVKDVLWSFVKFMWSDWVGGIKIGLNIAVKLFVGFARSVGVLLESLFMTMGSNIYKHIRRGMARGKELKRLMKEFEKVSLETGGQFGKPGTLFSGRDPDEVDPLTGTSLNQYKAWHQKIIGVMAETQLEASDFNKKLDVTYPLSDFSVPMKKLGQIADETAASIKALMPPELGVEFDAALVKLQNRLADIAASAEDAGDKLSQAFDESGRVISNNEKLARDKMEAWTTNAKNMWNGVADVAISTFDRTADALADFVMKGKADFASLADFFVMEMSRMIIKAEMAKVAMGLFGGATKIGIATDAGGHGLLGKVAGLQSGGRVEKTGLAKIHKGEEFSGVGRKLGGGTVTINVNAIDAAGTYQFLNTNKRTIATMLEGTINSNHSLRRSKSWKS